MAAHEPAIYPYATGHGAGPVSPSQMIAFYLFAVAAAVTPGPSNVMVTAAGANAGILGGLPCLLGVAAGMGLMMFLVPLGLGALVLDSPAVLLALKGCSAAFLLWLAWRIASSRGIDTGTRAEPVGFLGAAAFQWVNPKSWLVSASAAGSFLQGGSQGALAQALCLGGLFVLAALPCCFAWLAFGATLHRLLSHPRRLRAFNVAMGLLLAGSVVLVAA